MFRFLYCSDAIVHCDNQIDAYGVDFIQMIWFYPVPIIQSVRQSNAYVGVVQEFFEKFVQWKTRTNAIDIVVSKYHNFFFSLNRLYDSRNCFFHVMYLSWRLSITRKSRIKEIIWAVRNVSCF